MANPTISVVIPTIGRPVLARALNSVFTQTRQDFQVLLSVDGPVELDLPERFTADPRLKILRSDVNQGAGAARRRAVEAADTPYVAYLDDDDIWYPEKLERQMREMEPLVAGGARYAVVACRWTAVDPARGRRFDSPKRLLQPGWTVPRYLFERRTFSPHEAGLASTMLLMTRDAARVQLEIPDDRLHEDWALVMAIGRKPGAVLTALPESLCEYSVSPDSTAHNALWQTSLSWFDRNRSELTDREYTDALLRLPMFAALNAKDYKGIRTIASSARVGGWRSWRGWLLAAAYGVQQFLVLPVQQRVTKLIRRG